MSADPSQNFSLGRGAITKRMSKADQVQWGRLDRCSSHHTYPSALHQTLYLLTASSNWSTKVGYFYIDDSLTAANNYATVPLWVYARIRSLAQKGWWVMLFVVLFLALVADMGVVVGAVRFNDPVVEFLVSQAWILILALMCLWLIVQLNKLGAYAKA